MKAKTLEDLIVYRKALLAKAKGKRFISEAEFNHVGGKYIEICKMLTPWINYLQRCNWRVRGQKPDPTVD